MSGGLLERAERAWNGELDLTREHPLSGGIRETGGGEEIAPGVFFSTTLSNVAAFRTNEGLVLVDTGEFGLASMHHERIRSWDHSRLNLAVFSHGHIDHVFGVAPFEEEARANGWPPPEVIAHEAVPARFERYVLTAGYNAVINQRQFGLTDQFTWPTEYPQPDRTYRDSLSVKAGADRFELHHARGETDDHTWTWVPSRRVLCSGDLFIWATPNAGNPQKVQRYPREWARALRMMADLGAELLLPGHGFLIVGAGRIRQALSDTAELLEHLHDRTVEMMNAGATLDEIIHTVTTPAHLLDRPYLQPIYDDPEFVVRNVWRLYGGWYDGNPSRLKPPRDSEAAAEIAALAGGADRLAATARERAAEGRLRLAAHLADLAWRAAPDDPTVGSAHREIFDLLAETESSVMAKGIYRWAAGGGTPSRPGHPAKGA
ncbi:MAG TPA: alkyl sulfatase dimerization domain-containing protein [Actinomycetota bacterium]